MPSTVPLGPGEMSKTFDIGVLDNNQVDGLREIEITASVLLAACNCSAPSTSAGTFSDLLFVADNDGPSLSLLVNPLSLAEGVQNAGTLTIQRNTSTDNDLVVTLTSSDLTEIILPATATIPAGSASLDVPLSTETDNENDGNQQVTFYKRTRPHFHPALLGRL